jgi:hypothetical protein
MSINPNAALVAKQLKAAGLSKAQIAGVLGNFQLESGFNPRINEGGKVGAPMGRGGYGFAQWTGGRQTNLVNFAKSRKMDPGDPNLQTQFLIHELRGPEKRAFESLKGAVSPEESARRFLTDFERAGIPKTKQRQEAARQIYGKLGFLDAPAPGAASPTPQPATASTPQEKGNQLGTSLLQRVMGILPSIMPQRQSSLLPVTTPELSGQSFLDTYRMFFDDELV